MPRGQIFFHSFTIDLVFMPMRGFLCWAFDSNKAEVASVFPAGLEPMAPFADLTSLKAALATFQSRLKGKRLPYVPCRNGHGAFC